MADQTPGLVALALEFLRANYDEARDAGLPLPGAAALDRAIARAATYDAGPGMLAILEDLQSGYVGIPVGDETELIHTMSDMAERIAEAIAAAKEVA